MAVIEKGDTPWLTGALQVLQGSLLLPHFRLTTVLISLPVVDTHGCSVRRGGRARAKNTGGTGRVPFNLPET